MMQRPAPFRRLRHQVSEAARPNSNPAEVDLTCKNESSADMSTDSPPALPYARLNLRRNPFGELSPDEWAELAVVDTQPLVESLSHTRSAIQFIGDKGFGKTTHLLALKTLFPHAGYVHIPEGETRPMPEGSPLLVDEAQRMTWKQRRTVFPNNTPLVLGTHRDFERSLRRAGRHVVTIPVKHSTSPQRLHEILNRRIAAFRRQAGPIPNVSRDTCDRLLNQFGPNIRAIVQQLYEQVQGMSDVEEI